MSKHNGAVGEHTEHSVLLELSYLLLLELLLELLNFLLMLMLMLMLLRMLLLGLQHSCPSPSTANGHASPPEVHRDPSSCPSYTSITSQVLLLLQLLLLLGKDLLHLLLLLLLLLGMLLLELLEDR